MISQKLGIFIARKPTKRKIMKHIFLSLALLIAVTNFAQVKVKHNIIGVKATMFDNKEFKKHEFNKIVVNTSSNDVDWDKKILKEFDDLNVKVVSWMTLFPPVKEYTEDDIKKICAENAIDGIFYITQKASSKTQVFIGENQKETQYEAYLQDVASWTKAVVFQGSATLGSLATAAAPEKTTVKFVRAVHDDLKKIMTPESPK